MYRIFVPLSVVAVLITHPICSAEQIELEQGAKHEGRVVGYTDNFVQFEQGEARLLFELTTIVNAQVDEGVQGTERAEQLDRVETLNRLLDRTQRESNLFMARIRNHLNNEEFDALEDEFLEFVGEDAKLADGHWQSDTYFDSFDKDYGASNIGGFSRRLNMVEAWIDEHPDSVAATTAKIRLLIASAWAERGSGVSSTVTAEQMQRFKDFLNQTLSIGRSHLSKKMPPTFYTAMMRAGKGLGVDREEMVEWVMISSSYYPTYTPVFVELGTALLPKWGWNYEAPVAICSFAAEVAGESFAAESYYRCQVGLSSEILVRDLQHYNFDWTLVKQGFEDFSGRYQETERHIHAMAKLAARYFERQDAQTYFSQTVGEWHHFAKSIWYNQSEYERYQNWAFEEGDSGMRRAIIEALRESRFGVAIDLYDRYKDQSEQLNSIGLFGDSIIHLSADNGQIELLEVILEAGGDPNLQNGYGQTPLISATYKNQFNSIAVLLRLGADPMTLGNGTTSAHIAANNGYLDILKRLAITSPEVLVAKDSNSFTPLHRAVSSAQYTTVDHMLRQPQVIEYIKNDDSEWPLLIYAAFYGRESIVQNLVDLGAAIDARNEHGESALSVAQRQGFGSIAAFLQSIGAPYYESGSLDPAKQEARNLYNDAWKLKDSGDLEKAKELFTGSLQLDPGYEYAWYSLALVTSQLGDHQTAIEYIDRAIQISPDNPENLYWKGRFYHNLGQPENYRPLFQRYVELAPDTFNTVDLKTNYSQYLDSSFDWNMFRASTEGRVILLTLMELLGCFWIYIRTRGAKQNRS